MKQKSTARNLSMRPLDPEQDLPELVRLYNKVYGKETSEDFLRWKYVPPWADRPLTLVAFDGTAIIGSLGVVPLRGQVKGRDVPFLLVGDIMADPERRRMETYRHLNVKGYLDRLREQFPTAVMYGFMGARLGRFYRWFMTSSVSPCVGAADDRIVRLPDDAQTEADIGPFTISEWSWDASELNDLWQRLKPTVAAGLVRDPMYLNWRYGQHPLLDYRLYRVCREGQAVGWLVTGQRSDPGEWEDEVRIHDMLLAPEDRLPVLRCAAAALRARTVVFWLPPQALPGRVESRSSSWVVSHWPFSPDVSKEYLADNVYYTLGEADEWWK